MGTGELERSFDGRISFQGWASTRRRMVPSIVEPSLKGRPTVTAPSCSPMVLSKLRTHLISPPAFGFNRYWGAFADDKREGRGREKQADGLEYIGDYA